MTRLKRVLLCAAIVISQSACCPNGCFVLSGKAFDDLAHPPPLSADWTKNDTPGTTKNLDWESCRGASDGNFSPDIKWIKKERKPDETSNEGAYDRLYFELQRCMLRKGYYYIGKCYDNQISRTLPACGAP